MKIFYRGAVSQAVNRTIQTLGIDTAERGPSLYKSKALCSISQSKLGRELSYPTPSLPVATLITWKINGKRFARVYVWASDVFLRLGRAEALQDLSFCRTPLTTPAPPLPSPLTWKSKRERTCWRYNNTRFCSPLATAAEVKGASEN